VKQYPDNKSLEGRVGYVDTEDQVRLDGSAEPLTIKHNQLEFLPKHHVFSVYSS
jgi:hypothetical protein